MNSQYGGFLKWWYPTTMGFPTETDHFGVFWGYHPLKKHPYKTMELSLAADEIRSSLFCEEWSRIWFQRVTLHEKLGCLAPSFLLMSHTDGSTVRHGLRYTLEILRLYIFHHFSTISHPPTCGPELREKTHIGSLSLSLYQHLIQQHQVPILESIFFSNTLERKEVGVILSQTSFQVIGIHHPSKTFFRFPKPFDSLPCRRRRRGKWGFGAGWEQKKDGNISRTIIQMIHWMNNSLSCKTENYNMGDESHVNQPIL